MNEVPIARMHLGEVRPRTIGPRCGASEFRSIEGGLVGTWARGRAKDYFFRVNCMAALSKDMPGAAK